ncbi:MAG TPA: quinoprotein dehydrogenase-associated putative ABC transporter substrate-binding protein, partial [Dokdonella sp.]
MSQYLCSRIPVRAFACASFFAAAAAAMWTDAPATAAAVVPMDKPLAALRICGDPGNMPLSNEKGEGFENKIADVLADALGTKVTYFWRPYFERGLTRQTFDTNDCDVLMDMPADYESLLTTMPVYRTTYVLVSRAERKLDVATLDDPKLKKLKIGTYETSAVRGALANHGVKNNVVIHELSHDADLVPDHQPWVQVQQVADGKLDMAAVWGPFAGWLKTMKNEPLLLQPVNRMDDDVVLEFSLAIGTRRTDVALKNALDKALVARKDDIAKILADYGVPLVQCADCLVSGDIASHGRYTAQATRTHAMPPASKLAGAIRPEQVEQWLADGASVNQELGNAVLATDIERVKYLLEKNGADVNQRDPQGYAPLQTAARGGDIALIDVLLAHKADPNGTDSDGWTPLLHAVLRDRGPAVARLLASGARIETPTPQGYTPLSLAIEEKHFDIAQRLLDGGANVNVTGGQQAITPLMIVASIPPPRDRDEDDKDPLPVDIARSLIAHGANLDAVTIAGVTPLMIAAAHDNASVVEALVLAGSDAGRRSQAGQTALEIARQNGSEKSASKLA